MQERIDAAVTGAATDTVRGGSAAGPDGLPIGRRHVLIAGPAAVRRGLAAV